MRRIESMVKKKSRIILVATLMAIGASATNSARAATLLPDAYESANGNETRDTAWDLGVLGDEDLAIADLTIHRNGDVDYFKWTPTWGLGTNQTVQIEALFDHGRGRDLDMALRKFSLETLAVANSTNDNEAIVASLEGGQDYLIKVFGFGSSTNQYDLSIDFDHVVTIPDPDDDDGGETPGGGGGGGNQGGDPLPQPISTAAARMIVDLMDDLERRDLYSRAQTYYQTKLAQALKCLNEGESGRRVLSRLDQATTMLIPYRRSLGTEDSQFIYSSIRDIVLEISPNRRENTRIRRTIFPRNSRLTSRAIQPGGERGDGQASVGYNAATGEVWVDAPAGIELTSISVDSASNIFTGDPAQNLGGTFDNNSEDNIFKATFGNSFGSMTFGNVAQAGLSEEFLLDDLTVIGSLLDGGELGAVDLIYVPEPSTWALTSLCLLGLLAGGWKRRRSVM
jgi:hypothetical protein